MAWDGNSSIRKATTEGRNINWEAMVAEDHGEMDKKTTVATKKG